MNTYWNDGTELYHYGILGQKWGVRRYQNPDGTLTEEGKQRYNQTTEIAKKYAEKHAKLERATRELTKGVKKGSQILVTTETKEAYAKMVKDFIEDTKLLQKKYGEVISEIKSMDDGYDYVVANIKDDKLNGYVQYYAFIGKTQK